MNGNLRAFATSLLRQRSEFSCRLPERRHTVRFLETLLGLFFPHFSQECYDCEDDVAAELQLLKRYLKATIEPLEIPAESLADSFFAQLPGIHETLVSDAQALLAGDPAAESLDEVIVAYPGFFAIAVHRIAHEFYRLQLPILPRLMTEYAHEKTGVDIHPGATIGRSFFIDHGTGIVIGETTIIGKNVKLYQGVTLGALSVDKSMAGRKRHPTVEDNCVIYANAAILGGDTTIGHDSIIGGNVWLTESVPPYSTVYHKSDVTVRTKETTN